MLFWLPQDDLVETGETFLALNLGRGRPKTIFYRGGRGCRKISENKTLIAMDERGETCKVSTKKPS